MTENDGVQMFNLEDLSAAELPCHDGELRCDGCQFSDVCILCATAALDVWPMGTLRVVFYDDAFYEHQLRVPEAFAVMTALTVELLGSRTDNDLVKYISLVYDNTVHALAVSQGTDVNALLAELNAGDG